MVEDGWVILVDLLQPCRRELHIKNGQAWLSSCSNSKLGVFVLEKNLFFFPELERFLDDHYP